MSDVHAADALPSSAAEALAALHATGDTAPSCAWAPGRINIIGEHTDYNEGWVLPAAVRYHVAVAGFPIAGTSVECYSTHHRQRSSFSLPSSSSGPPQSLPLWARYIWAVFAELADLGTAPGACQLAIAGDVPLGGGMSSSAALLVAMATFLTGVTRVGLEPIDLARLCQRAEQRASGAQVGIMDHAVSVLGRPHQALYLDCRDLSYSLVPAEIPGWRWLLFDTGARHSTADGGYNARRAQCEVVVAKAQLEFPAREIHALRDLTLDDLVTLGSSLTPTEARRARHVITENERVGQMVSALRANDSAAIGKLLTASHLSLRDDYAVSSPELDAVAEIAGGIEGVAGARMMGAGFGGSVLMLVRDTAYEEAIESLSATYLAREGREGTPRPVLIGAGAQFRRSA